MAKKDFDLSETKKPINNPDDGCQNEAPLLPAQPGREAEESTMKNAHASGTGSIGRNESGLPDEDEKNATEETTY